MTAASDNEAGLARSERLQRVLAERGVASRRKAEELIRSGHVSVDGRTITELGTKVDPDRSVIRVNGKVVRSQPYRYVALNKPAGYITTTSDERDRRTVMELIPAKPRLYPVGRLDRETEGLLLFTNDGEVANRIMHPRYGMAKEYHILTPQRPSAATLNKVRSGVLLDGRKVVPREFRIARETPEGVVLSISLHEGMNRIVRRIMDAAGIPVTRLRRERIGPISVAGIPRGGFRELTAGELSSLLEALHLDRATGPSQAPRRGRQKQANAGPRQTQRRATDS